MPFKPSDPHWWRAAPDNPYVDTNDLPQQDFNRLARGLMTGFHPNDERYELPPLHLSEPYQRLFEKRREEIRKAKEAAALARPFWLR